MSILGMGIGASTVDFTNDPPGRGMGIGALVWLAVSSMFALFAGGYVAARLAGMPRREDSMLHGLLTWGTQTLVVFLLLATALGNMLSGTAHMLGRGLEVAGQGVAQAIPEAVGGIGPMVQQGTGQGQGGGVNWDAIKQDAQALLQRATGSAAQPSGTNDGSQAIQSALNDLFSSSGQATPEKREAALSALERYLGMSRPEAESKLAQWEQQYQQLRDRAGQASERVEQKAREVGDTAAKGISRAALGTFLTLVLGAGAATLGGASGRPKTLLTSPPVR
ncbi:MAG: hypothetical protein AB9869_12450 [Verrucomicrobiia bacterium]